MQSLEEEWFSLFDQFIAELRRAETSDWADRFERLRTDPYLVRQGLKAGPLTFWDAKHSPGVEQLANSLIELSLKIDPTSY